MVRKTHHGRPGYKVIQDDWGERLATAANQLHTSECEIRGPDVLGDFDPVTGAYEVTIGPLRYEGFCRVQRVLRDKIAGLVTEQNLPSLGYLVQIDHDADTILVRDIVTITRSEDGQLVGQELPVAAVVRGSMRATRDLYCTDDLST